MSRGAAMKIRGAAVLLCAVALGCTRANPDYCESAADCPGGGCDPVTHACTAPGTPDAAPACATSAQCADPAAAWCDPASHLCVPCADSGQCGEQPMDRRLCAPGGVCVECLTSNDCGAPAEPVCGAAGQCAACTADAQCGERADSIALCEAAGSCVRKTEAIFVDNRMPAQCPSGDGSEGAPLCQIGAAVGRIKGGASTARVVVIAPGTYDPFAVDTDGPLTVLGSGMLGSAPTVVMGANATAGIWIKQGTDDPVEIRGLKVTTTGMTPRGIYCDGRSCQLREVWVTMNPRFGIDATGAGRLGLVRSIVDDNQEGGVYVHGGRSFEIVNNFIYRNGALAAGSPYGVRLDPSVDPRVFRNNTLLDNADGDGAATRHVDCTAATVLSSNVFWERSDMADAPNAGTSGSCNVLSSIVGGPAMTGAGNRMLNPMFKDLAGATPDLHIRPGSPCRDMAEVNAAPLDDFDGQVRDSMPDIGADEVVP
jgi:hypothetical protein